MPSTAGDQHLGAGRERCDHGDDAERGATDEQQPPPADPVAQRPHGDQESRDHEPVDIGDPQQLSAAWSQVLADRRHGQVQHGQVHRIQQTSEGEHRQPDPLPPAGQWRRRGGHADPLVDVRTNALPLTVRPDGEISRPERSVRAGQVPVIHAALSGLTATG
jgi:hypothetical protein